MMKDARALPASEGRRLGDLRIGVDLGGTKIETAALDAAGRILARRRIVTPSGDAAAIVAAVAAEVAAVERVLGTARSVGVGTPGSISPASGLLRNANTVCLNGLPLDRLLSDALARPVRLANDANCFALSEAVDGAGHGAQTVFGVIIGTGVGGGVVIGRRLLVGHNAVAGEWGHNPLPWPTDAERRGPACYCGRAGCIETFLSGPGLAADHLRHSGGRLSARLVAEQAANGDRSARETLARYADRLARALATVVNLLDPDVIVLGGGVSNIPSLCADVDAIWRRYIFSDRVSTRLATAIHGDSSGVRGAAWLWDAPGAGEQPGLDDTAPVSQHGVADGA